MASMSERQRAVLEQPYSTRLERPLVPSDEPAQPDEPIDYNRNHLYPARETASKQRQRHM